MKGIAMGSNSSSDQMKTRTLSIEYPRPKRSMKTQPSREYTRSRLLHWSRYLDRYTSDVQEFLETVHADTESTDRNVVLELQDWGASTTSQILWVKGNFESRLVSSTTAIAVKVVTSAQTLQLPVVTYLCAPSSSCTEDDDLAEDIAIDFLYSLIRQLIYLLPSELQSPENMTEKRFSKFKGNMESFGLGLKVLEALIECAPKTLLIVIDGLEQLDDSVVAAEVGDVLEIL